MSNLSLKRKLRNAFAAALGYWLLWTGAVFHARRAIFASGAVTAVVFHNPDKNLFRKCLDWLALQNYTFVTEQDVLNFVKGNSVLPPGSIWLTFDDGWRNNLHQVVPILQQRKIPATFFICTEPITSSGVFWWSQVLRYRSELPREFRQDVNRLWLLPEERRGQIIRSLRERLTSRDAREAMTPSEVADLAHVPQIAIGSHTVHHVILPNCSPQEKRDEVNSSRTCLQEMTGQEIVSFAYPNGDHNGSEGVLLAESGYQLAVTIQNRTIKSGDDPFYLPRFIAMDDGYFSESICHLVGIWEPIMMRLKKFFNLRPNRFGNTYHQPE